MSSPSSKSSKSEKISNSIIKSSEFLASNISSLGDKSSTKIKQYSEGYLASEKPNQEPTTFDDVTLYTLKGAQFGVEKTTKGIGIVASGLGKGLRFAGKKGYKYYQDNNPKDPDHIDQQDSENKKKLKRVGSATITAFSNVSDSFKSTLEEVAKTSRVETVKCVTHKHGSEAGQVVDDSAKIGIDVVKANHYMGIEGVISGARK